MIRSIIRVEFRLFMIKCIYVDISPIAKSYMRHTYRTRDDDTRYLLSVFLYLFVNNSYEMESIFLMYTTVHVQLKRSCSHMQYISNTQR